ncbi:ABC transporter permease [uncultured Thioclava sp.]|uniref:ABC transporter permease n=1 Tax=uncultured Thioclava sp. TaxID=473858 RepID=UPI0025F40F85|nr:ABC transporter permease subunit [uncultured Thioclava sp.]
MTIALHPLRQRSSDRLWLVLGVLVALLIWELLARAFAHTYLIASPVEIARYLWANAGLVARAAGITGLTAAIGFVLGNAVAIALAALAVLVPGLARMISALALVVFCLPLVATGPILRVLWGPGLGPQITLAALAVYFTTFLPLMVGLRAAPPSWFDLVRSYGRGRLTALIEVRAMASLPYLFAGLQIAAPAAILGAMFGEFTGAERGMGVLTLRAMRSLDVAGTWALASTAATISMLAYAGLGRLGQALNTGPPPLILAPLLEGGRRKGWRVLAHPILVVLVLIALWWLSMESAGLSQFFAKRPGDVWAFLITAPEAAAHRATLGSALLETLVLALPGYLLGLALGVGLAMAMVLAPRLARAVMPIAIALRAIPIVITAPLIVIALGRGATGTITIVALMIFFPSLIACYQGLARTPRQVLELFDSYAASPLRRMASAQFPAMLPAFFAAARMAVPAAILAATTAEWLATGRGIGGLMALTASTSGYGMLWSAVVVLAGVAVAGYVGIAQIERAVLRIYGAEQLTR